MIKAAKTAAQQYANREACELITQALQLLTIAVCADGSPHEVKCLELDILVSGVYPMFAVYGNDRIKPMIARALVLCEELEVMVTQFEQTEHNKQTTPISSTTHTTATVHSLRKFVHAAKFDVSCLSFYADSNGAGYHGKRAKLTQHLQQLQTMAYAMNDNNALIDALMPGISFYYFNGLYPQCDVACQTVVSLLDRYGYTPTTRSLYDPISITRAYRGVIALFFGRFNDSIRFATSAVEYVKSRPTAFVFIHAHIAWFSMIIYGQLTSQSQLSQQCNETFRLCTNNTAYNALMQNLMRAIQVTRLLTTDDDNNTPESQQLLQQYGDQAWEYCAQGTRVATPIAGLIVELLTRAGQWERGLAYTQKWIEHAYDGEEEAHTLAVGYRQRAELLFMQWKTLYGNKQQVENATSNTASTNAASDHDTAPSTTAIFPPIISSTATITPPAASTNTTETSCSLPPSSSVITPPPSSSSLLLPSSIIVLPSPSSSLLTSLFHCLRRSLEISVSQSAWLFELLTLLTLYDLMTENGLTDTVGEKDSNTVEHKDTVATESEVHSQQAVIHNTGTVFAAVTGTLNVDVNATPTTAAAPADPLPPTTSVGVVSPQVVPSSRIHYSSPFSISSRLREMWREVSVDACDVRIREMGWYGRCVKIFEQEDERQRRE